MAEELVLIGIVLVVIMCCCMKLMASVKCCGVNMLAFLNFVLTISLISGAWGSIFAIRQHWDRAHAFVTSIANSTAAETAIQLTVLALSGGGAVPTTVIAEGG